ncbi:unnamed protein product [Prorocentrum cordatum]|uniref:Uncharacterized protein n=1 Tax=Prorocentrum cordatum TaxID=2364126 RepID=A0ABN9TWI4_9DINO|nr:unnamed protein product [Polarella glacialis]
MSGAAAWARGGLLRPPWRGQAACASSSRGWPRATTRLGSRPLLLELEGFLDEAQAAALVELADRTVRPEWEDDGLPPEVRNVSKMDCEEASCKLNAVVLAMYRRRWRPSCSCRRPTSSLWSCCATSPGTTTRSTWTTAQTTARTPLAPGC